MVNTTALINLILYQILISSLKISGKYSPPLPLTGTVLHSLGLTQRALLPFLGLGSVGVAVGENSFAAYLHKPHHVCLSTVKPRAAKNGKGAHTHTQKITMCH